MQVKLVNEYQMIIYANGKQSDANGIETWSARTKKKDGKNEF